MPGVFGGGSGKRDAKSFGLVISSPPVGGLRDGAGPGGGVDEEDDEQHHHGHGGQHHGGHLLPGVLHGLLPLPLVFGGLLLGFALELPHDVLAVETRGSHFQTVF